MGYDRWVLLLRDKPPLVLRDKPKRILSKLPCVAQTEILTTPFSGIFSSCPRETPAQGNIFDRLRCCNISCLAHLIVLT